MCSAFSQLGHRVTLYIPPYDRSADIFSYYGVEQIFDIKTIVSPKNFLRQIIHGLSCVFYFAIKKPRADIVITRNIIFTFFSTVFLRVPTIYDAHHPSVNKIAGFFFNTFKDSRSLIRFTTNSQGLADYYLKKGLTAGKLRVLHNGVELDKYSNSKTKVQARKITDLQAGKKLFYIRGIFTKEGV